MLAVGIGCASIALFLNVKGDPKAKPQPITIAVSLTPLSAPFYVAQAINAFDKHCIDVSIIDVVGGKRAYDLVATDEATYATSSDSVIAFQSLYHSELVSHAMFVQSDNDVKLLSKVSSNIEYTQQLVGKRIGVTLGTASEYFLTSLLALEGLTPTDVTLVDIPPDQLYHAIKTNKVEAIVPWEPFAFNAVKAMGQQLKLHQTKNLNSLSFNLVSKPLPLHSVRATKCLLSGLIKANEFIAVQPKRAKSIVQSKLNVDAEFIEWVWRDYIFKVGLDNSLLLSIESQARWAFRQLAGNALSPQLTLAKSYVTYIDERALSQLNPQLVNVH